MPDPISTQDGYSIVFAIDYDRTMTGPDLTPDSQALEAIDRLRQGGILCFLLTGRSMADLAQHPVIATSFDGYCLEGGAQWGTWGSLLTPNNAKVALEAAARLEAEGNSLQRRVASFSCARKDLEAVQRLASDCSIQVNHDRIDVLPPGLDKGIGLDAVLSQRGIRSAHVVALGDGENDSPLLRGTEVGLATADAIPSLKDVADDVLQGAGPAAVLEAARRLLNGEWRAVGRDPPSGPGVA